MLLLSSILALVAAKTKRKFFFKNGTSDTRTAQVICRSKTGPDQMNGQSKMAVHSVRFPKNWTGSDLTISWFVPWTIHHSPTETTLAIQTAAYGLKVQKEFWTLNAPIKAIIWAAFKNEGTDYLGSSLVLMLQEIQNFEAQSVLLIRMAQCRWHS